MSVAVVLNACWPLKPLILMVVPGIVVVISSNNWCAFLIFTLLI